MFKDFSIRQQNIMDFGFGTTNKIANDKQIKYPLMWVFLSKCNYTDNGLSEIFHFEISFFDRVMENNNNYQDVLSDQQYIYRQFVGEIKQHQYWNDMCLSLASFSISSDATYLTGDDNVNGFTLNIDIKMPIDVSWSNSPITPLTSYEIPVTNGINDYRLIGATGPQGLQGEQGVQGEQGIQGDEGLTGPQGNIGDTGKQGDQGSQGFPGGFTIPYNVFYVGSGFANTSLVCNGADLLTSNMFWLGALDQFGNDLESSNTVYTSLKNALLVGSPTGVQKIFIKITDASDFSAYNIYQASISAIIALHGFGLNITMLNYIGGSSLGKPTSVLISFLLNAGEKGNIGATGSMGLLGPQGSVGPIGPQGNTGANGIQGIQGAIGPQGSIGPIGQQGNTGANGSQGIQGAIGPQGNTGANGIQGTTGPLTINTGANNQIAYYAGNGVTISGTNSISNILLQNGNSFGAPMSIGTNDINPLLFEINNTPVIAVYSPTVSTVNYPYYLGVNSNNLTLSGTAFGAPTASIVFINVGTASPSIIPLVSQTSTNGNGNVVWHFQMNNSQVVGTTYSNYNVKLGIQSNSNILEIGVGSLTHQIGGSITWNSAAAAQATTMHTINAVVDNPLNSYAIGSLINLSGILNASASSAAFVINNTLSSTSSTPGTQSMIEARRNSNTVFRLDINGGISAGTVSNATQSSWKLGKPITAVSTVDTSKYIEINVDGIVYKLATMA